MPDHSLQGWPADESDDPADIEPEVSIDGNRDYPRGRNRTGFAAGARTRQWAAVGIAIVLVFFLGVAVGNHFGGGPPDAGPTVAGPSAPVSGASTLAGSGMSSVLTASGRMTSPAAIPHAAGPTADGACGRTIPLARIAHSQYPAPPRPTGIRLLAGRHPRPVDVDAGIVGEPLVDLFDFQYATGIATDSDGIVITVTGCGSTGGTDIYRITPDGAPWKMTLGSPGLIAGGERTWLKVAPSLPTDPVRLRATDDFATRSRDNPGDSVTLPQGFAPQAGSGDYIVGTDMLGGAGFPIQVYDLASGGIVDQFADRPVQFVVGDHAVVWAPRCGNRCTIHRYDLGAGSETKAKMDAASGAWQVLSPDGSHIVAITDQYTDADDGANYDAVPQFGLRLISVSDGHVVTLPGLDLGPATPSVTFSADSAWLIVAVPGPSGEHLLLYDTGNPVGPYDTGITLPGPPMPTIPLAVAGPAAVTSS